MENEKQDTPSPSRRGKPKYSFVSAQRIAGRKKVKRFFGIINFSKSTDPRSKGEININIPRLLILLSTLAIVTYLGASVALYAWRKTIPNNQVTYADIVLPHRWLRIKEKVGQTKIAQAKIALENEKYRRALMLLRAGLRNYPHDNEARSQLCELYARFGLLDQATVLLKDSLTRGYPGKKSVTLLLEIAKFQQNSDLILELGDTLLSFPEVTQDKDLAKAIHLLLVTSFIDKEKYTELYAFVNELNQHSDHFFHIYDAQAFALVKMERFEEAFQFIDGLPDHIKRAPQHIILVGDTHLQAGQYDAAVATYKKFAEKFPMAYRFRSNSIASLITVDQNEKAEPLLQSYLKQFQFNDEAITHLASTLTDIPSSEYVERCLAFASELSSTAIPIIQFFLVQCYVSESKWEQASHMFNTWAAPLPDNYKDMHYHDWMKALLQTAEQTDRIHFNTLMKVLEKHQFEAEVYLDSAVALQTLNQEAFAAELLGLALKRYPMNKQFSALHDETYEALSQVQKQHQAALQETIQKLNEQRNIDDETEDEEPTETVADRIREMTAQ